MPLAMQLKPSFPAPELVSMLMKAMNPVYLEPGDYLMHQGDDYDGIYFMESGQVSVFAETATETENTDLSAAIHRYIATLLSQRLTWDEGRVHKN